MAAVVGAFTTPKTHAVIKQLQATLEEYRKMVQEAREKGAEELKALGSPTASLAITLLETLQGCD
eukprot:8094814-Pyramimonas_sp.AAC.1